MVFFSLILAVSAAFAAVLALNWFINLSRRKQGYHGYPHGREAGLGEDALDYIKRNTGVNNITLAISVDRLLDCSVLAIALRRLQAKYALFRTHLVRHNRTTYFKVLPLSEDLAPIGITHLRSTDWQECFHSEVNTPFISDPLGKPYMLGRITVIDGPLGMDAPCVLLVTIDHRIADGFSAGIIFDELIKEYAAVCAGGPDSQTPLKAVDKAIPLDPPTEELGPPWLMLPPLFCKTLALVIYIAVFIWRFRGFTLLPLRMSSTSSFCQSPPASARDPLDAAKQQPILVRHLAVPNANTNNENRCYNLARSDPSSAVPAPPPIVKGLSHISGLFREPSIGGLLRVPWTTAAEFGSLTEEQTRALLAVCKTHKVTITSALFAAMSIAIAEKEAKDTQARYPMMLYSYTLLDLRRLSKNFIDPIRLGLHISSIFNIATLRGPYSHSTFWEMCTAYQREKARAFLFREPWRNLLLQWLLAHAGVFLSMCSFYRGPGAKWIHKFGRSITSLSPTFAISNMGSLDHFTWTASGAREAGNVPPEMPLVKEVYGGATIPVSWPFCLLLTSSVNNRLKLNFAFTPQAIERTAIQALQQRVIELLVDVASEMEKEAPAVVVPSSPPQTPSSPVLADAVGSTVPPS